METPEDMIRRSQSEKQEQLERQWAAERDFARSTEPRLHQLAQMIKPLLDRVKWEGARIVPDVYKEYDGENVEMAIWEAPQIEPRFLARIGVGSDGRAYVYCQVGIDFYDGNAHVRQGWIVVGARPISGSNTPQLYLDYLQQALDHLGNGG